MQFESIDVNPFYVETAAAECPLEAKPGIRGKGY